MKGLMEEIYNTFLKHYMEYFVVLEVASRGATVP